MREFDFTLDQPLVNGLTNETFSGRNKPYMQEFKNMRPTEYGAAANQSINTTITNLPATSWPFPQIFKGETKTLCCANQAIYEVDESTMTVGSALKVFDIEECMAPSTDIITNGDFTSTTGWTLGAGWAASGGAVVATASTAALSYATPSPSIADGATYRVRYEITAYTSGDLKATVGSVDGEVRTATGIYEEYITASGAGGAFSLQYDSTAFTGTVDNVSVELIPLKTIVSTSSAWHFADFGDVWFLTNGSNFIANLPYFCTAGPVCATLFGTGFSCESVANIDNRLVLGGLGATHFQTTDFTDAYTTWVEWQKSKTMTYEGLSMDGRTLVISTQSGGDYYWPFVLEMALLGFPFRDTTAAKADLKANYIDAIEKGQLSFQPLNFRSEIKMVKPLGAGVACYGNYGISMVTPRAEGDGWEPIEISTSGIAGRNAVAGDRGRHVFVDRNNSLWSLTANGELKRLIGTGRLNTMVTEEATGNNRIMGSYDPEEMEYFLCNDERGFKYTKTGLCEITILPTSLILANNQLYGAVEDLSDGDILLTTSDFDMGLGTLKTIHSVEIRYTDITNLRCRILHKYNGTTTYSQTNSLLVNGDGTVTPIVTANDFRLQLTGTPGSAAKIDYITIRYQVASKVNIRGTYNTR